MEIKHLIFLIHPGCYGAAFQTNPEAFHRDNSSLYLDREREVTEQWLNAASAAGASRDTLLVQLYGDKPLFQLLKDRLGASHACYAHAEFPGEGRMFEYHQRLAACALHHMDEHGLSVDFENATSELWGESFEGCVTGYGSAFAEHLGFRRAPRMRFEMTVFDSRFLQSTKRWEVIRFPDSDVEAWLFDLHDGTPAAMFQSRLKAQWLDERPIDLRLNPVRVQVCTTMGHTVWPLRPWRKGDSEEPESYRLRTKDNLWVRGMRVSLDELRNVISSAVISSAPAITG